MTTGRTLPGREPDRTEERREERGAVSQPADDPGLINIEREYQAGIDAFRRSRAVLQRMKEQDEKLTNEFTTYREEAVTFGGGVSPERAPAEYSGPPGSSSAPQKGHNLFTREPAVIVGGLMSVLLGILTIAGVALSPEQINATKVVLDVVVPTLLPFIGSLLIRKKVTERERIDSA